MQFHEATSADRERILALRARCFGDTDPEKADPRFWDWEFSRGRMFVGVGESVPRSSSGSSELLGGEGVHDSAAASEALRGTPRNRLSEELVTHLAMLDLPHMLGGREVRGALAVDAMTSPDARGQGAFTGIVRYALEQSGHHVATAYQIRKAVLGAMLRGGWAVAERVPVLMRPALTLPWGQAELPLVGERDLRWMSALGVQDGCIARTPAFLSWRFLENPRWQYRVTGIPERGYLAARRTTLKGFDTLAIVDLAFADRRAARMLVRDAISHARTLGCSLVAAFVSRSHPAFWTLVRHGFVPGPHWFRLLVHPPEHAKRPWRVMWADTDHL